MNRKQIITIIIVIAVLILAAVILTWKPWVKKTAKTPTTTVTATQVNDINAMSPVLSADGQTVYYYDLDVLNLAKMNLATGEKTQLSSNFNATPANLYWAPDQSAVIIKILYNKKVFENFNSAFTNTNLVDGASTLWYYNIAAKKLTLLDSHIVNPAPQGVMNPIWTADSKNIVYNYTDGAISTLNLANPDGSKAQKIGDVPTDFFSILSYDSTNKTVYYTTALNLETEVCQVYKYNLSTKQKDLLFSANSYGLPIGANQFIVSNDKSILYNTSDNSQKTLPILIDTQKAATNPAATNLLADVIASNHETFKLIDLTTLTVSKTIDPGLDSSTNYTNLSLDKDNNIFYINSDKLFEIKQ